MKIRVIVDSTADLMPQYKERVRVVPLTVHFGDEEYIDGVTIDHHTFYQKLIETDVLPTTSQATPAGFAKEYAKAKEAGEACIVLTLSAKLSGTYQSAVIAAQGYENVYVIDTESAAIGAGILTELAFSYIDQGMDVQSVAAKLEEEKKKIVIVALVDTLEYLHKGGRLSKTVAIAGAVLKIKPVLSVIGGNINVLGKAMGSKRGNNLLVQEIEKAGGVDFTKPVLLGYSGISNALLLKYIEDSRLLWENELDEVRYATIGSVIGTHAGPGAVAVAFFKK
ncbi:MAG: DegV family protein [Christensenellales bacterium]|jgi:DegV family protein with EDD domain|nr:DegV family protein [Clostridiales bacterium]